MREPSITEKLPQQVASRIRHRVVDEQRLFLQRFSQTAAWRIVCSIQRPVDDVRVEVCDVRQTIFTFEALTEDLAQHHLPFLLSTHPITMSGWELNRESSVTFAISACHPVCINTLQRLTSISAFGCPTSDGQKFCRPTLVLDTVSGSTTKTSKPSGCPSSTIARCMLASRRKTCEPVPPAPTNTTFTARVSRRDSMLWIMCFLPALASYQMEAAQTSRSHRGEMMLSPPAYQYFQ